MNALTIFIALFYFFRLSFSSSYLLGKGCLCELESAERIANIKNPQTLTVNCFWPYVIFEREKENIGPSKKYGNEEIDFEYEGTAEIEQYKYNEMKRCSFGSSNINLLGITINCIKSDKVKRNETTDNIVVRKQISSSYKIDTKYCKNVSPLKISNCERMTVKSVNIEMTHPSLPYLYMHQSTSSLCNLNVQNICFLEVMTSDDKDSINFPVNKLFDGSHCDVKPKISTVNTASIYFVGYDQLTGGLPFTVEDHLQFSSLLFKNISVEQLSDIEKYLIKTPGKLEIETSCDCHSLWLLEVFRRRAANQNYVNREDKLIFCQGVKSDRKNLLKLILKYTNEIESEKPDDPFNIFAWELSKKMDSVKDIDFIRLNCTDLYTLYNSACNPYANYSAILLTIFFTILYYLVNELV